MHSDVTLIFLLDLDRGFSLQVEWSWCLEVHAGQGVLTELGRIILLYLTLCSLVEDYLVRRYLGASSWLESSSERRQLLLYRWGVFFVTDIWEHVHLLQSSLAAFLLLCFLLLASQLIDKLLFGFGVWHHWVKVAICGASWNEFLLLDFLTSVTGSVSADSVSEIRRCRIDQCSSNAALYPHVSCSPTRYLPWDRCCFQNQSWCYIADRNLAGNRVAGVSVPGILLCSSSHRTSLGPSTFDWWS